MITKDNLHAGHRERMMRKVLSNVDSLEEHELLEVLLFTFMPRIDTNPIAHELIRFFGSLEKVFSATAKDLTSVNGVGEKTACYITVIGAIYKKLLLSQKPEKKSAWKNFEATKNYLIDYYDGIKTEEFLFILLDSKFKEISKMKFEDKNKYTVTADIPEIAKALVVHKPSYALIAHNHPSGNINLSESDDITTMKINMICELHGVSLIDHVVVAGKNAYSYFTDGKLQHIKEISSVNKILRNVNGKGE